MVITPFVTSQVLDEISILSPPSPIVSVPRVVHVLAEEILFEPIVPPATVRTSDTSLSAHGFAVLTQFDEIVFTPVNV